ncbi:hypothetical protein ACMXYX_14205 [Neptuniibacter sp. QD72_48]|uniref:hypothetical protein n=1 Tax=unclassified Neptuniibacter TaxID=2630693 RepID=UPI0039F6B01F
MKSTAPKNLKSALKAHYQDQSLSEDKLAQLLSMQEELSNQADINVETPKAKISWFDQCKTWFRLPQLMVPTLALACIFMVVSLMPMPISGPSIVNEIAGHHEQPSEISIYTSSIDELGQQLTQLSFKLISSSKLGKDMWQLIGGSYCSINGEIAAQLKVRNIENNQIYTFYQAEYPEGLTLEQVDTQNIINNQGTAVTLWQEGGLLLGIAHTTE